jgi:hypothetical protein
MEQNLYLKTFIMLSGQNNVGDGHTVCVDDPSTFKPPKDYEIRGTIPMDRIDNIISAAGRDTFAVKMDTEGSEANTVL